MTKTFDGFTCSIVFDEGLWYVSLMSVPPTYVITSEF